MNTTKTRLAVAFAAAALLTLGACTSGDNTPAVPPTQGDEALPLITEGTPSDWMDGEEEPVLPPDYTAPVSLTIPQIRERIKTAVPGAECADETNFDLDGLEKAYCHLPTEGAQVMIARFDPGDSNRAAVQDFGSWKHYAEWPTFSLAGIGSEAEWVAIVKAINATPGATS